MRQTPRRQRNPRGEFIPATEDQVPAAENQVVANFGEQRQVAIPPQNNTGLGALVALKNWQIAITPDRAQVCLWSFIMTTKFLSMLSVISFWVCITMCTKTFPSWDGGANIFGGFVRRREIIRAGNQLEERDGMWEDIFPLIESLDAYSLKISLTETARPGAPVIYGYQVPILFRHPLVWASLAAVSFLSRSFLSFIHGSLEQAYNATTAHQRSTRPN